MRHAETTHRVRRHLPPQGFLVGGQPAGHRGGGRSAVPGGGGRRVASCGASRCAATTGSSSQALAGAASPPALRAASALPDLGRGLGLLREIQRTGDIFFPQNWAGALLGGHASREAQACVEAFLAGLPADYPPRLRKHVEVELDRLRRCWRLRGR